MAIQRYACLRLPSLPLEAQLRAEPSRRGAPLVVVENPGPAARVVAASPEARTQGIELGIGVAAARRRVPEVEVRVRDAELETHALEALEVVGAAYSPALELGHPGTLYLDATGVAGLFGGEEGFAAEVLAGARARALEARVGVASTRVAALAAAAGPELGGPGTDPITVVPAGEEARFLAPLPVGVLEPEPRERELLRELGLRRCGDLQALRSDALEERLGPGGADLATRARGEDPSLRLPAPRPEAYRAALEPEQAFESLAALEAATRALLGRLVPRLVEAGLAIGGVRTSLSYEGGGVELRLFHPAVAAREVEPLARLLAERLRSSPPTGPVQAIELELRATRIRPVQLSLFLPAGPSPRRLHQTVSRVEGLVGPGRLGTPARPDDHRPAAFARASFRPPPPRPRAREVERLPSPVRAFRPPRPVRVQLQGETPVGLTDLPPEVRLPGRRRIRRRAGPWHLSGGWWTPRPFRRAYWDLELEDGVLLRVFLDLHGGRWWVDGVHD